MPIFQHQLREIRSLQWEIKYKINDLKLICTGYLQKRVTKFNEFVVKKYSNIQSVRSNKWQTFFIIKNILNPPIKRINGSKIYVKGQINSIIVG